MFATGCDQSPASVTRGNLVGGVASASLVEEPALVESAALWAGVEDQGVPATPTPQPSRVPGVAVGQAAVVDPPSVEADGPAVADDLVAEARAQLSSRSGSRADLDSTEPLVEQGPDVVAASEKLANARQLATAEDWAALSVATAVQPTPTPKPAPRPAPKPAPRPAPKVVVRRAVPTPKPVVRAPAPRPARPTISSLGQRVVSIALRYVGYRYSWGGISPSTGFDCSGFTYYVYLVAGRPIPRSLSGQYATGRAISRSALQPGDLIFFHDTSGAGLSHAAIYIGGGRFVNSQSERVGVAIASLGTTYWSSHYLGARRP